MCTKAEYLDIHGMFFIGLCYKKWEGEKGLKELLGH